MRLNLLKSLQSFSLKRNLSTYSNIPIDATSSTYLEQMYREWMQNPNSVHTSLANLFSDIKSVQKPQLPSFTIIPESSKISSGITSEDFKKLSAESVRISQMIKAFQLRGHLLCDLDPLKLPRIRPVPTEDLNLEYYGFNKSDLDREFDISIADPVMSKMYKPSWKLSELLNHLKKIYCNHVGIETGHIHSKLELDWIAFKQKEMYHSPISDEKLERLFHVVQETCELEAFFVSRYRNVKRFSISGEECLTPTMEFIIKKAIECGVKSVIIGMPHRGRISVLRVIMQKEIVKLMADFQNRQPDLNRPSYKLEGDVKYHLGITHERLEPNQGKKISITLMPNPSHLEAVVPMASGRTRGSIDYFKKCDPSKTLCILVHGDAAFSGQGVVYETINMSELENYKIGGTIHLVINNQIGFTSNPEDSRSGHYCTDIAKVSSGPILHVNGEDPEAIIRSSEFAAEYRQKFLKDIVIDLVGYRKWGHNENDEPRFTQPIMYKIIDQKEKENDTMYYRIRKKFLEKGIITEQKINSEQKKLQNEFIEASEKSKSLVYDWNDWIPIIHFKPSLPFAVNRITSVEKSKLLEINEKLNKIPANANSHRLALRTYEERYKSIKGGANIAWATAESLAFASLLIEGIHVRLSGQDVQRGTFTHRHAFLHDQQTQLPYIPLNNLSSNQGIFTAANSNLSEYAVLAYELGYSYTSFNNLVIWEAQFGDFANGAQIAIDNCVVSGESKWGVPSGIILLLPHGYDGQGAEHSSARIERFLQLSDDNMNVCHTSHNLIKQSNFQCINCTSPANYFHAIRRQIKRDFRKPLIVFVSKALYRDRQAVSNISEFSEGSAFRSVIGEKSEEIVSPEKVKKLIFCSGQVFFDLLSLRNERKKNDIAIVRVEQLAPYPGREISKEIDKYKNAKVFWCQEEHMNMGAYSFMKPRFDIALKNTNRILHYVGREPSASTASGFHSVHQNEKEKFLNEIIDL